jgi:intracellular sulfur oxidation DsrE/DsrF family protein
MQKLNDIDDQMLGAFVDGQLDPVHCAMVVKAVEDDPDVRERVYNLRRAKDLMKLGFGNAQAPTHRLPENRPRTKRRYSFGVAASLVAAVIGFGSGTLGYYTSEQLSAESSNPIAAISPDYMERVIIHVNQSDPELFAKTLDYIENFLQQHQAQQGQIEVIANAGGLDLLRKGVSPFESQVVAMMRDYSNVQFVACANAIQMLRTQGIEPEIIDNVPTEQTSIERIVDRLQGGWAYVRVDTLPEI